MADTHIVVLGEQDGRYLLGPTNATESSPVALIDPHLHMVYDPLPLDQYAHFGGWNIMIPSEPDDAICAISDTLVQQACSLLNLQIKPKS